MVGDIHLAEVVKCALASDIVILTSQSVVF